MRFLGSLKIPVVATLRDSQNYVRAAECGVGLFEMKRHVAAQDLADWNDLLAWLKQKESCPAVPFLASASLPVSACRPAARRLVFLVEIVAHLLRPVLVAVPAVERVRDRTVPSAGLLAALQ
jgi:hypothetical protein